MTQFINWGLVVLTGLLLFVGFGLLSGEKKDKKSYIFFGGVGLFFIASLFILPYSEYQKVQDNIKNFQQGKMLQCYSSVGLFGTSEQYMIANDQWDQKDFNFIKKDNRLVIRANHCE